VKYSAATELNVIDDFRHVMSLSPTPVTIVTADTDEGPQGIVIGSFVSVSLEPPLVGFFVGKWTRMWQPMNDAKAYCVNILAENQSQLSKLFITHDVDRFAEADWDQAGNGAPGLAGVVAWIEANLFSITDAGDHDLVLLEVTGLRAGEEQDPLIYHRGQYSTVRPAD